MERERMSKLFYKREGETFGRHAECEPLAAPVGVLLMLVPAYGEVTHDKHMHARRQHGTRPVTGREQ